MGCSPFKVSGDSYKASDYTRRPTVNPDPSNYEVIRSEQWGNWLLLMLRYPDCTTYEGKKVLLYKDVTFADLMRQIKIDPHFSNNDKFKSPIARFEPTERGWLLGRMVARGYGNES